MNLRVHIDELVLHGFAPGDRARIGDAVQSELARLFRETGVPPGLSDGGGADRLTAGSFHASASARPETTGGQIAAAVYRGLGTWASE
jgi:hypothetical protein